MTTLVLLLAAFLQTLPASEPIGATHSGKLTGSCSVQLTVTEAIQSDGVNRMKYAAKVDCGSGVRKYQINHAFGVYSDATGKHLSIDELGIGLEQ